MQQIKIKIIYTRNTLHIRQSLMLNDSHVLGQTNDIAYQDTRSRYGDKGGKYFLDV